MGRRGRKRVIEREQAYWQLLSEGMGTVEACRQLGIGRKTGYRWRAENGGLPPVHRVAKLDCGRYLSLFERQRIASLHAEGLSLRRIAERIGRSASTVSRELRRNCRVEDLAYDADVAHRRASQRRLRPREAKIAALTELKDVVQSKLKLDWSPEQISAHLRISYPASPQIQVSVETIYQALYIPSRGGLSRELTKHLRTGRSLRRRGRRADERKVRYVAGGQHIDERPDSVADRTEFGHWEGDLITGQGNGSAIGTLIERSSRYCKLVYLPKDHTSQSVCQALAAVFHDLPPQSRKSLTWDQGVEMADHPLVSPLLTAGVFFCDPASPWQRGSNENTNGLLRQYFPKSSDLRIHTLDDLLAAEDRLNNRPRKLHQWITPAAIFAGFVAG